MTIVAGIAPGKPDRDGVEYAALLARSAGTDLRVVCVVPGGAWPTPLPGGVDREYAAYASEAGDRDVAAVRALLAELAPDVAATVLAARGRSVPSVLIAEVAACTATLVVLGAGADGAWGRVVVGSAADRLLHSSPVPVAVATRGFRAAPGSRVGRVTVGFRGDSAAADVLGRAAELAGRLGAGLRVATFGVRGRTMYPPEVRGEEDVLAAYLEQTARAQRQALDELGPRGLLPADVESVTSTGADWAEAVGGLPWGPDDLLVVGSSPAGLVSRVFLGSSAAKILRHSPVPVVVVP
ncbi:universal stress protein [Nocardioides zeae]|uniref:Universal stress protein n=1 Tax=Nocardioides imazamoxiresistens TaxID=3231893 RepID=A0ABU3PX18_9ACTN|nr:universal stress protein [Nocardioides zeae]MDT9593382.1 universal stress protein [Nocardioides zeae]